MEVLCHHAGRSLWHRHMCTSMIVEHLKLFRQCNCSLLAKCFSKFYSNYFFSVECMLCGFLFNIFLCSSDRNL